MFEERCSVPSAMVLSLAAREADQAGCPAIHTGHLVAALVAFQDGVAARALQKTGVGYGRLAEIQALLTNIVMDYDAGQSEFADVMLCSILTADFFHSNLIEPEHLLLALFSSETVEGNKLILEFRPGIERTGAQLLRDLGVDPISLHREVVALIQKQRPLYNLS